MGLKEEKIPADALFTPGHGTSLLKDEEIRQIQKNNNFVPVIENKSLGHSFNSSADFSNHADIASIALQLQEANMQQTNTAITDTDKLIPPNLRAEIPNRQSQVAELT